MRFLLAFIVYLFVFNSISAVILHNEVVIETNEATTKATPAATDEAEVKKSGEEVGEEKRPIIIVEPTPEVAAKQNDPPPSPQSPNSAIDGEQPAAQVLNNVDAGDSSSSSSSSQITPNQTNETVAEGSTSTGNNKSSQAEMVRAAAGVVVVNKAAGEEMQSFEEWKEMRLKAGDKSTTTSSSSATDSSSTPSSSSSSSDAGSNSGGATTAGGGPITSSPQTSSQTSHDESSHHQRRKNYASAECGAKIVANNPESNKPSNILSENKDDYMLNSCSNRVWFVVELCEPVRITEFELANFELFSNVPKQFRVYASERYVASSASSPNWPHKYLVGTFEAANMRAVQKFAIKDALKNNIDMASASTTTTTNNQVDLNQNNNNQAQNSSTTTTADLSNSQQLLLNQNILMYAKYVRFEMLSHYGSEHYCPLSLVRIFGTSISDDEEAAAAAVSSSEGEGEVAGGSAHTIHVESTTTPATTTTTKGKGDAGGDDEKNSRSDFLNRLVKERVNLFAKSSQFLSNIIATFLAENFNLSKLFTIFSSNTDKNTHSASSSSSSSFSPSISDSTLTTPDLFSSKASEIGVDRRNQVLQIDLHKVLCFSSMRNTFDCCQCLPEEDGNGKSQLTTTTFIFRPHHATSNNWMSKYCGYYFLMITSAQAQLNTSLLFKFLNNIKYSNGEAPLLANFTRFSLNNVNYYILNEWLDNQTAAHFYFKATSSENNSDLDLTPGLNLGMFASSLEGRNITSPPLISPDVENQTNDSKLVNAETPTSNASDVKPTTIVDETNNESQQQQLSTEEVVIDATANESSKNPGETSSQQQATPPPPSPPVEDTTPTTTSTSTSSSSTNSGAQIPTVVTPVIIGNGKDAVLMRLSNRVKILELNMTLSSQYLEKLSQHYKKQMDEMQRAFNVTTSALLETIRIADERDLKQNERIVTIERRVDKMQNSMEALENLLNDLKFQTDILIWTIIVILNIIIIIEVVRWLRNTFSSSSSSSSSKPRTINRTISSSSNQQSSARIHLSASEIEALIEERVRRATESLREELLEKQKQMTSTTTTTTMTEPQSPLQRVETLATVNATTLESAIAQPQAAAAAAAVVSSTLATVVAIAAAATAQCSTLGAAAHHGEEKS